MAVAFAISLALHEIVAGVVPKRLAVAPAQPEVVTRVAIVRVTVRAVATPHLRIVRIVYRPPPHLTAHRAAARIQSGAHVSSGSQRPRPKSLGHRSLQSKPSWDVGKGIAASANGAGAGAAGSGAAAEGERGNDAATGDEPCGFVTFSDPHGSQFDPRTRGFRVDIRMSVHFASGSTQSVILDYPWYYVSEAANPWSDANLKDPSFPTRFQTPPPEKLGGEPELVRYVIEHSTPDGMTLLKECPTEPQPGRNRRS
ncbi:MAG: hypothetical protein WBE30_03485 [Candidatus Cybelea sp.]